MTDETKAEIVRRFAAGESFGVLAEAYGVKRGVIAGIVHRYGTPRGKGPEKTRPPYQGGPPRRVDWGRVADLWRQGASFNDIGAEVGCDPNSARYILVKMRLIQPNPGNRKFDPDVVVRLRQKGLSQTNIAKLVGCSQPNISRILRLAA